MALYSTNPGDRILAADINQFYNILKGVAASGESITLIYNAAGVVILQPSSDPAAGTELIQIKNNAGTVQSALSSDGKFYGADGTVALPGHTFESEKSSGLYRIGAGDVGLAILGVKVAEYSALGNLLFGSKSANVTAAATTDLSTATGNEVHITGATTITAFGTMLAGTVMRLIFDGAPKVTYNATSVILAGATDFYATAGDRLELVSEGSGNWREVNRAYGTAAAKYVTAALGGDVTMTNANQYYDGASASLTAGIWAVTATVEVYDNTGTQGFVAAKLWDATTALASAEQSMPASAPCSLSLTAIVNIAATTTYKISAACTQVNHVIKAATVTNGSGNNASRITAVRLF